MNDIAKIAKEFSNKHHLHVFPVTGKEPLVPWKENKVLFVEDHPWDRATGYGVRLDNITVIDIDTKDPTVIQDYPQPHETFTVSTNKGFHLYYRGPSESILHPGDAPVDILSGVRYVIGPGSLHPDGAIYTIINDASMAPTALARDLLTFIFDLKPSKRKKQREDSATSFQEGYRNDALCTYVGNLLNHIPSELHDTTIMDLAVKFNDQCCDPPMPKVQVHRSVKSMLATWDSNYLGDVYSLASRIPLARNF